MSAPLRRALLTRARLRAVLLTGLLILLVAALVSLFIGPASVTPAEAMALLGDNAESSVRTILLQLRLPRIALAISVGAALASCGVLFQAMLRNPLADPYTLGVASGCTVGAITGYLLGANPVLVTFCSFAGGALVILAVLWISRGTFGVRSESMLLGGVMVGAICAALMFLLLHFVGPNLRSAVQWMLGDLSSTSMTVGYWSLLLFVALMVGSLFTGGLLNALSLGDEEAASLGVNVPVAKGILYLASSLIVGLAVSFCGAIGFVGLVVPHILRGLIGSDNRLLLPASVIGGGVFLLLSDTVARSFMSVVETSVNELPIGAITALVGAPIFISLLRKRL